MESGFLIPALAFSTLGIAVLVGIWSVYRIKRKSDQKKSSLAKDGPGPQPIR